MINHSIIKKYNIPVPRYTSYPPANYFKTISEEEYKKAIEESNTATDNRISFYLHIPFCKHLCHYCGCNSFPMMKKEVVDRYIKALHQEIEMITPMLNKDRKIAQIHYGGGSPTALPTSALKELNEHLLEHFDTIEQPEIAIECHPGYLTEQNWVELTTSKFNRFSLGIQDFNEEVLKVVHRKPSLIPIETIFTILRDANAKINMDFLYGLPLQTVDSFRENIIKAIELAPDRLVTFSYAHVPWVNKRQLILEKAGLPTSDLKQEMFEEAKRELLNANYAPIGMDHFVKPNDELNIALKNHQLHRNFQGYCTRRTTAQVYALGVTGISQMDTAYAQNTKNIDDYIEQISKNHLPILKGYKLTRQEQLTRAVIESVMCNYAINWHDLAQRLRVSVDELKSATALDKMKLNQFCDDGIIIYNEEMIMLTQQGRPFVRNVAASLDRLMINTTKSFSKPI